MTETLQNQPTLEENKPLTLDEIVRKQVKEGDDILWKIEAEEELKKLENLRLEFEIRITSICNENLDDIQELNMDKYLNLIKE